MKGSNDPSSPYVDPPLHARIDVNNGQSNVAANGSSFARLKRGRPLGSKDSVPRKSVLCPLEHFIKQFRGNLQGSTSSPLMVDSGLAGQCGSKWLTVARLKCGRPLGSKDSVPRKRVLCPLEHFIKRFRGNLQGSTSSPLMVDSVLAGVN
ncbi:unnamed protein product [Prunus armeniaca]|uniref:Uncharacterized protein n=1 Tax=Prunus armeniaca TaxID=36596 RepID=A0A6J5U3I8_PRUAR|nr:unnamed protein product [Prunus armeniaca]